MIYCYVIQEKDVHMSAQAQEVDYLLLVEPGRSYIA